MTALGCQDMQVQVEGLLRQHLRQHAQLLAQVHHARPVAGIIIELADGGHQHLTCAMASTAQWEMEAAGHWDLKAPPEWWQSVRQNSAYLVM